MDELQLLREMRKEVPIVKDSVLDRGRGQLLRRIDPQSKKKVRRRTKALRISVVSVAALALATALVATDVVGIAGWRGGSSAQAAEVLDQAAEMAIKTSDPVVGPGQYLKIDSTNLWLTMTGAHNPPDGVGAHGELEWLDTEKMSTYIPFNRGEEWVWERSGRNPTAFFDTVAEEFALNQAKEMGDTSELLRGNGGAFYGSPSSFPDQNELAGYARDPRMLLNSIYLKTLGSGQSVDGQALVFIADLLRTGIVPADLRAALYKAAALIPDVTITDSQATLDGQKGIAIGRLESVDGMRHEIIIDPETGQLVGERSVLTEALRTIPAGTVVGWTTINTSVVDAAP